MSAARASSVEILEAYNNRPMTLLYEFVDVEGKDLLFECSSVFYANWKSLKKYNINQGGTSSTKTYSIMQCLFQHARQEPNTVITVTSEDIPALKKGAYRDAETIYNGSPTLQRGIKQWNKTERIIYFNNGSIMEFTSNDSTLDARQGKRHYLFVNEANSISHEIFWQLAIRTSKKVYIDYNPSIPFWAHDMVGKDNTVRFISDHRHNPFISQEMHDEIENDEDPERWWVYGRGRTGNVDGLIYPNWVSITDELFHNKLANTKHIYVGGIDFGYTNDPTAVVQVLIDGTNVYMNEVIYESDITIQEVATRLKAYGWHNRRNPLYCDHDPDAVADLRREGFRVLKARKGKGSVLSGILLIKKHFKVHVTESSRHLWKEQKHYSWDKDKATGNPINYPIDEYNHGMDALRYAIYSHSHIARQAGK